ncbi:MAG: reverse gyrase [Thermoprotei archaeon]|nr:MAG: reverse gyrase [Thermoprotei archaeon]
MVGVLALNSVVEISDAKPVVRGIYRGLCMNCGGEIEDLRLLYGLPCSRCLPLKELRRFNSFRELAAKVVKLRKGSMLDHMAKVEGFVQDLESVFRKCVGSEMWSIQRTWAYRVAQKQSFAMIAPTGVGKTTFGLVVALYLAMKGLKTYIVVPTTVLVEQYEQKLQEFSEKLGFLPVVIAIHSKLPSKRRAELEEALKQGSFDIVITTTMYLQRKFESVLRGKKVDLVFVDDVDAVMKGSKAIEYILQLIGFDESDIEMGYRSMRLRVRLATATEKEQHKLFAEFESIQQSLRRKRERTGMLILSSATGRARGRRVKLFRELLGFDIGGRAEVYRNVVDVYVEPKKDPLEVLLELVRKLGRGGLVYVPVDRGIEEAERVAAYLRNHGIAADTLVSGKISNLDRFANGELDVLVGVAVFYGLLVRGIDLPEHVRYAIFLGVPRHKISLRLEEPSPQNMLRLSTVLVEVVDEGTRREIMMYLPVLRRIMRRYSPQSIAEMVKRLVAGEKPRSREEETLVKLHKILRDVLLRREIIESLRKYPRATVIEEEGRLFLLIPDAATYVQASGRTSRLFAGGITRGLSVVIVDDVRLLHGLEYRLKWYIEDFSFKPLEGVDLGEVIKQIDEDRELVKAVRQGKMGVLKTIKQLVRTALMVVESPNKARTIANFFGRPTVRDIDGVKAYEVDIGRLHLTIVASGGHVFDLVEDDEHPNSVYGIRLHVEDGKRRFLPVYGFLKRCLDCGHQFVTRENLCPLREALPELHKEHGMHRVRSSENVIRTLQKLALEVDEILIGTDPDAEGEKIGFDIALALAPFARSIKRIEFHEITRRAILKALENPRPINMRLVEAQITRRIEDRWIGFALSELATQVLIDIICKYEEYEDIERCKRRRLSAGRVQTPTLGRIIEVFVEWYLSRRPYLVFRSDVISLEIPADSVPLENKKIHGKKITIVLKPKEHKFEVVNPPPPFTTDVMITEASVAFRMPAPQTMALAQELFELGLITYHRTDSTRVSTTGINVAREYLQNKFGKLAEELFKPRSWGEGGAHEAIRPTRSIDSETLRGLIAEGVIELPIRLTRSHFMLYDMIFRRFVASQMKPAVVEKTVFRADVCIEEQCFYATDIELITSIADPGFTLVYMPFKLTPLPPLQNVVRVLHVKRRNISSVRLMTQGDVVRWMKEVGIGRPSTYAKIVDTLLKRGYVIDKKVLIPMRKGVYVYTLLSGITLSKIVELATKLRDEEKIKFDKLLKKKFGLDDEVLKEMIRRLEETVRSLGRASIPRAEEVLKKVASMVSVERTSVLQKKMSAIEEGVISYEEVIEELFRELSELGLLPVRDIKVSQR